MKFGIKKHQWPLLIVLLLFPLFLNAIAICLDIGTNGVLHLLNGSYQPLNPNLPPASLPEILWGLFINSLLLGVLTWFIIFISNREFFQKQWLVIRLVETVLAILFIGKVFEIVTGVFMPLAWLPEFHAQILLPTSSFMVQWSLWFIFPATVVTLFIAMLPRHNLKK